MLYKVLCHYGQHLTLCHITKLCCISYNVISGTIIHLALYHISYTISISPRVKYKVLLDNTIAEVDNMSAKVTIVKLVVSLTLRQYIPVRDDARIKVMGDTSSSTRT